MLGYLNEHLQLKRQALNAYQRLDIEDVLLPGLFFLNHNSALFHPYISLFPRAVELLQPNSSKEELTFALGNYGRALW